VCVVEFQTDVAQESIQQRQYSGSIQTGCVIVALNYATKHIDRLIGDVLVASKRGNYRCDDTTRRLLDRRKGNDIV